MEMKDVAILLNAMLRDGVIQSYAVFGAVAQMRYTGAVSRGGLADLSSRHGLSEQWESFQRRFI